MLVRGAGIARQQREGFCKGNADRFVIRRVRTDELFLLIGNLNAPIIFDACRSHLDCILAAGAALMTCLLFVAAMLGSGRRWILARAPPAVALLCLDASRT